MESLLIGDNFAVEINPETVKAIESQTGNLTDLRDWEEKQVLMKDLPIEQVRLAAKAFRLKEEKRVIL